MSSFTPFLLAAILLLTPATPRSPIALDQGRRIDEYGALAFKQEQKRLDVFARMLANEANTVGFVVIHEGAADHVRDAKQRICRSLTYLTTSRKVAPGRLIGGVVFGGFRKALTVELWVFPSYGMKALPGIESGATSENIYTLNGEELPKQCPR